VFEAVRDRGAQQARHAQYQLLAQVTADHVAAEWKRQSAGFRRPPLAQVDDAVQSGIAVGQLAFVNDETRIRVARSDVLDDPVERHDFMLDIRTEQLQGEERGCHRAGNGDSPARQIGGGKGFARHHPRPVALAHGCAVRQQRIAARQIGVCMNRHGGDFQLAGQRPPVQCLDVLQLVLEAQITSVDLSGCQGVEHERVVRIR